MAASECVFEECVEALLDVPKWKAQEATGQEDGYRVGECLVR